MKLKPYIWPCSPFPDDDGPWSFTIVFSPYDQHEKEYGEFHSAFEFETFTEAVEEAVACCHRIRLAQVLVDAHEIGHPPDREN